MNESPPVSPEQPAEPEKRPRGRQKGWTKADNMIERLPPMRVPDHLYEWLGEEAKVRGLKIPDMARMLLLEVKAERLEAKARKRSQ